MSTPVSMPLPTVPENNRFRLLLVEEDEATARLILEYLGRTGFDCRHASDAETALAAFADLKPHLLLTQASSAQIDGQALCRWVRDRSAIPVVLLGPNDETLEVSAFKIGADDYLSIPIRPAVLMARVVAQLRRAYRYNVPPKADNPFGMTVDEPEKTTIPSGWAQCDKCGYAGPRFKFEKEDLLNEIKMTCPNCGSTEHVVFSL
jgi:DNA-binding response OmpR family regulator